MENYIRIVWEKGLDISPEIFVRSDNYHIAERHLLGRFLAFRNYGILPNSRFRMEGSLDNGKIVVRNLECTAITCDGHLINIQSDMPYPRETELKDADDALYLVLSIDPYILPVVDEQSITAAPNYYFVLRKMDEEVEKGIPILKMIKDAQGWKIDDNYIPPVVALNTIESLKKKHVEIKNLISQIIEKLPESGLFTGQLTMLNLEWKNYTLQESPEEFVLLLKKFCLIFQHYLKTIKNIVETPVIKQFMDEPYNHLEIGNILRLGFESLKAVNQEFEEKPKEEPITEIEIKV